MNGVDWNWMINIYKLDESSQFKLDDNLLII